MANNDGRSIVALIYDMDVQLELCAGGCSRDYIQFY